MRGLILVAALSLTACNDRHRWTRERIADWVATLEASDPVPQTPEGVRTA